MGWEIRRGDIYWGAAAWDWQGSEEAKSRPWLVISNDKGNIASNTVVVAGISTQPPREGLPVHVAIGEESGLAPGRVMLEQIRTLDKSRLDRYIGYVPEEKMQEIDKALRVSLGLRNECSEEGACVESQGIMSTAESLYADIERCGVAAYLQIYKKMKSVIESI